MMTLKRNFVIQPKDRLYPINLKKILGGPEALYFKGRILKSDWRAVAIVGSRKMSEYGRQIAWHFSSELAKRGITIVSGLAKGVDTIAHQAALSVGGRTIAVLGSGLDIIYPRENLKLAKKIEQNGALISEFGPGTKPLAKNFLVRNRIIAGLSLATLVVEGERRSGTLSTATHAANQGREVFAVPGPITAKSSGAPHFLIQMGAKLITRLEDILEELPLDAVGTI